VNYSVITALSSVTVVCYSKAWPSALARGYVGNDKDNHRCRYLRLGTTYMNMSGMPVIFI
jgi:hypothetical protein